MGRSGEDKGSKQLGSSQRPPTEFWVRRCEFIWVACNWYPCRHRSSTQPPADNRRTLIEAHSRLAASSRQPAVPKAHQFPSHTRKKRSTRPLPTTSPTRTLAPITAIPQSLADEALVPRYNFAANHTNPDAQKNTTTGCIMTRPEAVHPHNFCTPPARAPSRRTLPGRSPWF